MLIYLSGGMRSNWQDIVRESLPGHIFLDPRKNETDNPKEYTLLDLVHIQKSDLVLAYLAPDNPSGYGLSLEIGFARGIGKPVIFVSDHRKYVQIVEEVANIVYEALDEAIVFLKRFQI